MKVIGITKDGKNYDNYPKWIEESEEEIQVIHLDYNVGNLEDVEKCDGIVLIGGVDVHPKFYNNERLNYPPDGDKTKHNIPRDEFEKKVFDLAREKNLPILGICRGMQLVNCLLGGDLIQDLEEVGKENHRKDNVKKEDRVHKVNVAKESLLSKITQNDSGIINSAHHQALGKISNELIVSASSTDDVIEAVEYKDKTGKPFLLCVQWHPERLNIPDSLVPFSKNIREAFLAAVKKE